MKTAHEVPRFVGRSYAQKGGSNAKETEDCSNLTEDYYKTVYTEAIARIVREGDQLLERPTLQLFARISRKNGTTKRTGIFARLMLQQVQGKRFGGVANTDMNGSQQYLTAHTGKVARIVQVKDQLSEKPILQPSIPHLRKSGIMKKMGIFDQQMSSQAPIKKSGGAVSTDMSGWRKFTIAQTGVVAQFAMDVTHISAADKR